MVDVLTTPNPGSGGSDKAHYYTEGQYLNETAVESSVNKLGEESSRSDCGCLLGWEGLQYASRDHSSQRVIPKKRGKKVAYGRRTCQLVVGIRLSKYNSTGKDYCRIRQAELMSRMNRSLNVLCICRRI